MISKRDQVLYMYSWGYSERGERGKLRPDQTAEIIARVLEVSKEPEAVSGLNPNDDVRSWAAKLAQQVR